ncbi:glycosyltransferase family 2 protein [Geosporobacter ferrireducens]|uniref:Glycosyl transferase n=1 Tax=Geosporobacter ferrireducens TaxID=1424294 RepID=A0A1D8GB64_9FIRM|nr:glycosyltransferase family 2 protein [Geosporobacter ferrireducens]AOT68138.1 glycosyl transferase [Geosporobacter ferrireducens]MTI54186.1 glycosyltransferase family 2 protein [Geosporobacter ferrireducens]
MTKRITVILPAYNEEDRVSATIAGLHKSNYVNRILVIDDGSKDQTSKAAETAGAEVYRMPVNAGKGYAMQQGVMKTVHDSDIIVFLDADIGESASEIDKLIEPIFLGRADVTIARFPAAKKKGGFGLVKNLAKYGVQFYTGKTITTSLSGQRAFNAEVLKSFGNIPVDYGVEVGMTIDLLRMGYQIQEVDVNMTHRETGRDLKGFIHRGKQFYQILATLIRKSKGVMR